MGFNVDDIAGIEADGLNDVESAAGVVEVELGWGKDRSGCRRLGAGDRRLIEHRIQLFGQRIVIGEKRERESELSRGLRLHHIERLPGGVFVLLENPVLDLGAFVGEDDLVLLVLNGGEGFSSGGHGGRGGWSLRAGCSRLRVSRAGLGCCG